MEKGVDNPHNAPEEFLLTLDAAMSEAAKDKYTHFDFNKRITAIRSQLDSLDTFTNQEEFDWLMQRLNKRSTKDVLTQLSSMDAQVKEVKANQERILSLLQAPVLNDQTLSKAELAQAMSSYQSVQKDVEALQKSVDTLRATKSADEETLRTVGSLQTLQAEVHAVSSRMESLQNTFYTLYKKVEMNSSEQRMVAMEQKIKELVEYLHQLSGTIGKVVQVPPQR